MVIALGDPRETHDISTTQSGDTQYKDLSLTDRDATCYQLMVGILECAVSFSLKACIKLSYLTSQ